MVARRGRLDPPRGALLRVQAVKVYLAGPMTGIPEFNFPAFNAAAEALREFHEVINPAENDGGDASKSWAYYMRQDIQHVLSVDAVVLLPGWRASRGANLEVTIATALEIPVWEYETMEPPNETILQEAQRLVYGDRQATYGHPADDYGRTAQMWSAILGVEVTAKLAALCMCAVKISREVNAPKRDNLVDLAGYAGVAARVQGRLDGTE